MRDFCLINSTKSYRVFKDLRWQNVADKECGVKIYKSKTGGQTYALLGGPFTDIRARQEAWDAKLAGQVYSSFELSRPLRDMMILFEIKVGQPNVLLRAPEFLEYRSFLEEFDFYLELEI